MQKRTFEFTVTVKADGTEISPAPVIVGGRQGEANVERLKYIISGIDILKNSTAAYHGETTDALGQTFVGEVTEIDTASDVAELTVTYDLPESVTALEGISETVIKITEGSGEDKKQIFITPPVKVRNTAVSCLISDEDISDINIAASQSKTSAESAKASAEAAKTSEEAAKASEEAAKASEKAARASELSASGRADAAAESAESAYNDMTSAFNFMLAAQNSATDAASSKEGAENAQSSAEVAAAEARVYGDKAVAINSALRQDVLDKEYISFYAQQLSWSSGSAADVQGGYVTDYAQTDVSFVAGKTYIITIPCTVTYNSSHTDSSPRPYLYVYNSDFENGADISRYIELNYNSESKELTASFTANASSNSTGVKFGIGTEGCSIDSITNFGTVTLRRLKYDALSEQIANKVEKVEGKGLSTNDYTDNDKSVVDNVQEALASKLDKVTPDEVDYFVYGTGPGVQSMFGIVTDAQGLIPRYTLNTRRLFVDSPTEDYDATNKSYVDNAIASAITTTLNTEV